MALDIFLPLDLRVTIHRTKKEKEKNKVHRKLNRKAGTMFTVKLRKEYIDCFFPFLFSKLISHLQFFLQKPFCLFVSPSMLLLYECLLEHLS